MKGLLLILEKDHLLFQRRKAKAVLMALSPSIAEYKWLRNEWLFRSEFAKLEKSWLLFEKEKKDVVE